MAKLTKAEKQWVAELNALLARCPSDRIGFYTIGDAELGLYDRKHQKQINEEGTDPLGILQRVDGIFAEVLSFPNIVDGICG